MKFLDQIFQILNIREKHFAILSESESLTKFQLKVSIPNFQIPDKEILRKFFSLFPKEDSVTMYIKIGVLENQSVRIDSDFDGLILELKENVSFKEAEDKDSIIFEVFKNDSKINKNIYDLNLFLKFLNESNCINILEHFYHSFNFNSSSILHLNILQDEQIILNTKLFKIRNNLSGKKDIPNFEMKNRDECLKIRERLCHFNNSVSIQLLPQDFHITNNQHYPPALINIFNKLTFILLISSLADVSTITDNRIKFDFKGYKSKIGEFDLSKINIYNKTVDEYYKIYEWVYSGKNSFDKFALARNILSMHIDINNPKELKGFPFYSIKSSYEIYLKENIKQYLDIKGKLTDQLFSLSTKANAIADNFASNFKKSIFSFVSFFASLIVLKVLTGGGEKPTFSQEAITLSFAFLGIVLIYLIYSNLEIWQSQIRFIANYKRIKESYLDLLNADDLQNIVNHDKVFNSDLMHIKQNWKIYNILWLLVLVLFGSAILYVSP